MERLWTKEEGIASVIESRGVAEIAILFAVALSLEYPLDFHVHSDTLVAVSERVHRATAI